MMCLIIEEIYDNFIHVSTIEEDLKNRVKKSMFSFYDKFACSNSLRECI